MKFPILRIALSLGCLLLSGVIWVSTSQANAFEYSQGYSPGDSDFIPGRLIVRLKSGNTGATDQEGKFLSRYGLVAQRTLPLTGAKVVSVPAGQELDIMHLLQKDSEVDYVEPDYRLHGPGSKDLGIKDPGSRGPFEIRRGLATSFFSPNQFIEPNDYFYFYQWAPLKINAHEAWAITPGASDVVVAVLSTGIWMDHNEFRGRIVQGYDFVGNDQNPTEEGNLFLGTTLAGLALAKGNNGEGIAGISWNSQIMPVRILDENGGGSYSVLAQGLYYAAINGAHVILIGAVGYSPSRDLDVALDRVRAISDAAIIAPVGDCGKGDNVVSTNCPSPNPVPYPASNRNVIAVSATEVDDTWKDFSDFGSYVKVSAPGGRNTISTWAPDRPFYGYVTWPNGGTFLAAAQVAGVASLIYSVGGKPWYFGCDCNPTITPVGLESILRQSAIDLGDIGWDAKFGWGRVDAIRALQQTPHRLTITEQELTFSMDELGILDQICKRIDNSNTSASTWSLQVDRSISWLTVEDPTGDAPTRTPSWSQVCINPASNLLPGVYTTILVASSRLPSQEGMQSEVRIPVTFTVANRVNRLFLPMARRNTDGVP
ncbi:MAG: hypothetical protein EXR62_01955 [Chloroflexi bacterium]|nr:hypothetical protein [Chloroflexota bacterium]